MFRRDVYERKGELLERFFTSVIDSNSGATAGTYSGRTSRPSDYFCRLRAPRFISRSHQKVLLGAIPVCLYVLRDSINRATALSTPVLSLTDHQRRSVCRLEAAERKSHPCDVSAAPEAPSVHRQLEANFAVLLVLISTLGALKLRDSSHFRSPLGWIVHVVSSCCC